MTSPMLHPATSRLLHSFLHALPQSLLLHGEQGTGLFTTASWLAGSDIAGELHPQSAKGERDDTSGTIGIEAVRGLYETTRAKYTGRRIIIIDNADRMSHGAQNAFLKLLEEPNEHTYFILTTHHPQNLLPTVRSRLQHARLLPVSSQQTEALLSQLDITDPVKRAQLRFVAMGLPAELFRLAQNASYFEERAEVMRDARTFLQGSPYEKLILIQKYKGGTIAPRLICDMISLLRRSLSAAPRQQTVRQLEQLERVYMRVTSNQNVALQLARIVL
jgi:hypothetical protein